MIDAKPEIVPVVEFPGYGVSRDGRVWSKRNVGSAYLRLSAEWREMRLIPDRTGHLYVGLCRDRKRTNRYAHYLVLTVFVGPRPDGMEACHFPERNPANNRVENLRWDTRRANMADKNVHGTGNKGEKHPRATLTEKDVLKIRELHATGRYKLDPLARMFNVHPFTIGKIIRRVRWSHI